MLHGNAMIGVRQAIDGIWMDGKGVHYADSFTEDGIMQAGPRNVETPLVGQENLIRMAARPAPSRFRHIVPNVHRCIQLPAAAPRPGPTSCSST